MSSLAPQLAEILSAVSQGKIRKPQQKLVLFHPLKGKDYVGDLMVVGRAVNSWGEGWLPEAARQTDEVQNIINRLLQSDEKSCPMSWVESHWESKSRTNKSYSTGTSAFWRVIHKVMTALSITEEGYKQWPSRLIWSNLYKVAPDAGGNPSASLIKIQRPACIEMLQAEIQLWKPRRLLFLTGDDWAQPFLVRMGAVGSKPRTGIIQYAGRLGTSFGSCAVVVGPHPQGKPEQQIVRDVVAGYAKLEDLAAM